jgi:glycine/D-amino acid oxidase-like deaminating enzyme
MGSATALFAARQGADVVLYDSEPEPFTGASRWNEGKIHLGFLYAGDPSFRTAKRILPGGLAFRPLLEQLLDCELENITATDDTVLLHRDSVVDPEAARAYFGTLGDLIRSHPTANEYLADVSNAQVRRLSDSELELIADPTHIAAGFAVPERSISTQWVADRFIEALAAEPGIERKMATTVLGVDSDGDSLDFPLRVTTSIGVDGPFDFVVNALWHGRPRVDATVGIQLPDEWSYRHRLAAFITTQRPIKAPSAVVCTGPFGDIKNYNDRQFYVSWYPTFLTASGAAIDPPAVPKLDCAGRKAMVDAAFLQLGRLIPSIGEVREHADEIRLEGGWVCAVGSGELGDPKSTLHRRDRIGINRVGSYLSVDTGKYSVAPWLARQVADIVVRPYRSP